MLWYRGRESNQQYQSDAKYERCAMIAIERFLQQAVNQPSSAEVEQLVLHDMGTSTRTVYCVSLLNLQVVAVEAEHSKQVSWSD